MLFQTTPAHEELRAKIRAFAEEEIKPLAFLLDQNNEFPDEPVKKMAQLGWLGLPFPKEYGGAGLDILSYAIAVEELARVDGGTGVILSAHVSLGATTICSTAARSSSPTRPRRTPTWYLPSPRRTSAPGASPPLSWKRAGRALNSATTTTRWAFAPPPRRS